MSRVASKNTKPELKIRRLLHGMGYRYRTHVTNLPGKPDIVFLKRKKLIFVHGCFWHGHENCKYGKLPKSRIEFWTKKIERNRARDAETLTALKLLGWNVLTVWQCELKDPDKLTQILQDFLGSVRFSEQSGIDVISENGRFPMITKKQVTLLKALNRLANNGKKHPTQREIAEALSFSQSNCAQHIKNLLQKGYLRKEENLQIRNIRLSALARQFLMTISS